MVQACWKLEHIGKRGHLLNILWLYVLFKLWWCDRMFH